MKLTISGTKKNLIRKEKTALKNFKNKKMTVFKSVQKMLFYKRN